MTYLQLVNSVLRRLREDEVSAVSQNAYSKLVGELVNEAKQTIEQAWDWTALRTTKAINTSQGTYNYAITDSQNQMKILDLINDTSNTFMQRRGSSWMRNVYLNQDAPEGSPLYYTYKSVDSNGDNTFDVYPTPDGVYSLNFNVVQRTPNLSADTDRITIPNHPVVLLATALGARERGETGGTSAVEQFGLADRAIADAVAFDAAQFPDETIWTAV